MHRPKILIAGVGNELRQDDAFGIEFARFWQKNEKEQEGVRIMEVGIGGIHLVQELHRKYDVLILADAVEWGGNPGEIYIREVDNIADLEEMPLHEKRAFLADMHYTNPLRALMLAKAIKVLPSEVYILGCEAAQHDDFAMGMSEQVKAALPVAASRLKQWLKSTF